MSAKFDFKTLDTGFAADWPVKVGVPADGGLVEVQTFTARFRTATKAEGEELANIADYVARLKALVRLGFVALGKGEDETLTDEMFEKMWAAQNVRSGLIAAYTEFQTAAPAKN